jgi:hypothetical protein
MRYLLLIYLEPPPVPPSPQEWEAMSAAYDAYTDGIRASGQFLGGEALQDVSSATTVSVRDGRPVVTDGPFAETKEHLAGYYLIEASDLDAAIESATRIPGARLGRIEVRPIRERS